MSATPNLEEEVVELILQGLYTRRPCKLDLLHSKECHPLHALVWLVTDVTAKNSAARGRPYPAAPVRDVPGSRPSATMDVLSASAARGSEGFPPRRA